MNGRPDERPFSPYWEDGTARPVRSPGDAAISKAVKRCRADGADSHSHHWQRDSVHSALSGQHGRRLYLVLFCHHLSMLLECLAMLLLYALSSRRPPYLLTVTFRAQRRVFRRRPAAQDWGEGGGNGGSSLGW